MPSDQGTTTRYRRLVEGRDWYGHLTLDNFDAVADRLRAMIGNGQPYTWVATNELFGIQPEVRTDQVAREIRCSRTGRGHIIVTDTYGVWGLRTNAADQNEARERPEKEAPPYLVFQGHQLQVQHHAPAGQRLHWVIAVQGGENGE